MTGVRRLLVVGTGLLGTSVGLAATRAGIETHLVDRDPRSQQLAADLGAGRAGPPDHAPDVVMVAVPPDRVPQVVHHHIRLFPHSTFSDVASVKADLQRDIESLLGPAASVFVGGHPLAGRERSGPEAARADLFDGRPWVLAPGVVASRERVQQVAALVEQLGAVPVEVDPEEHDRAVALVSHVPQVLASALSAQLVQASPQALQLAGQGLRDTTRIAASDPALWRSILQGNAGPVAQLLRGVQRSLEGAVSALEDIHSLSRRPIDESTKRDINQALDLLETLVREGQQGHARIPGKHGAPPSQYAVVPVVIPDQPGALARLLVAAGEAGINVEDVAIEHSAGQAVGLVGLSVAPGREGELAAALREGGWTVH